jgi:DNA-binding response OmpR family regulator
MDKILLVGDDAPLQSSRAKVLALTGADVTTTVPRMLSQVLSGEEFDIIVLCHSIPLDARRALVADVRSRWLKAQVIQVTTDLYNTSANEVDSDATVPSTPSHLISCVNQLLNRSTSSRPLYPHTSQ